MTILAWIVLGLIAGAIVGSSCRDQRGGIIPTTLLGIAGALIGGYIGRAMGYVNTEVFSWKPAHGPSSARSCSCSSAAS